MFDNIKVLKLMTGEVLVGEVTEEDAVKTVISYPIQLFEMEDNKLLIRPWLQFASDHTFTIYNSALVTKPLSASDELSQKYQEVTGKIVVPSAAKLLLH